jgi:hypothetical protein
MKIPELRGFWSLRPTLTARGFELGGWLAAAFLAVALVISPTPPAGTPARVIKPIGVPKAPDLLAYRQHCIDRVLASDLGMTEEYVVRQINQQCTTRRRTAARPAGLPCGRPFVAQLTPIVRRATTCVGS